MPADLVAMASTARRYLHLQLQPRRQPARRETACDRVDGGHRPAHDLTALLNPATGALASSRSYSPFGQVTATGGTQTALGYQDQYTDPGSGNVNMGAPAGTNHPSAGSRPATPRVLILTTVPTATGTLTVQPTPWVIPTRPGISTVA
jgi:hypothetical protein